MAGGMPPPRKTPFVAMTLRARFPVSAPRIEVKTCRVLRQSLQEGDLLTAAFTMTGVGSSAAASSPASHAGSDPRPVFFKKV